MFSVFSGDVSEGREEDEDVGHHSDRGWRVSGRARRDRAHRLSDRTRSRQTHRIRQRLSDPTDQRFRSEQHDLARPSFVPLFHAITNITLTQPNPFFSRLHVCFFCGREWPTRMPFSELVPRVTKST